jgi:hypothetical protein
MSRLVAVVAPLVAIAAKPQPRPTTTTCPDGPTHERHR